MKPTVTASKRQSEPRRHPRGFALVVTLSLMILLTVIAVGLLSLSSISLRSSSQGEAMQSARANARLALMLAIGQVQQATGPDQRVTVVADQRPKSADGKETAAAEGNRHWTGVFRSWPSTAMDRPSPEFLSWMVSGNPTAVADAKLPDAKLPDPSPTTDAVELVGAGTLGTAATLGRIKVPTVKVSQNGKAAKLAWWVGDQGMKAAISTPVPATDNSFGAIRAGLQSAPRSAVEFAAVGAVKPFATIDPVDPRLGRIASWQSAGFLSNDPKTPQPLFHDLAPSSTGLLTNVAAGGFRKDLSLRLERQANGTGVNAPPDPTATALYTLPGASGTNEPGINLNELWVYYNSYKDIKRSGSYKYTTSGQLASSTPHLLVESSPTACASDFEFFLKQPTVISYQMVLSLQAFPVTVSGAAVNRLHLIADPVVTLWNPLDIPVAIPQASFISVKYWQIPYSLNVKRNGVAVFNSVPLAASLSNATQTNEGDQNYMSIQLGTSQAEQIVLKPGEVVKFSQSGSVVMGLVGGKNSLIAKKGFNYGGGFALPLKDLAGKFIDLKTGDQITYDALANQYTAGKTSSSGNSVTGKNIHTRHFSITHHEVYVGKDRDQLPNSLGYGNMAIDWDFGNARLKQGEIRASGLGSTKPSGERLYANNFQEFFRPVAGQNTRPLSAAALLANKAPFMLLTYDAKTDLGSETATRSLTRFNPKAHHVDIYELTADERDRMPYEFRAEPMVTWVNRSLDLSPDGSGFFGGGMNGQTGTNRVSTHSLPREPLVSLAAFQHSFANGFVHQKPQVGYAAINAREPMLPQISHAIGNSLAPAMLAPDKTEGALKGSRPLADHSFLANRALWDDYFLSGVAPQEQITFGKTRDQKTVATEFFTKDLALSKPLPVIRYKPVTDGDDAGTLITSFFSGTNSTEAGFLNLASYLRVDGLFNINSTSEEAWKAMLGSLKGRQIIVRDAAGKETVAPPGTKVPVAGLQNPDELVADGSGSLDIRDPSQWVGRRELSETEISELAKALVIEIRKRGPFLSLADFVNRRVGTDKDLARAGALQSALDSTTVGVNKAFGTVGAAASRFVFPEAEQGSTSFGIPGIVKQADLLTPIAPVLSARSDSFIIRAYGESVDAAGKVTARAWCEAVVERDRNFIDRADKATTLPTALNSVNTKFGRRYEIISFRWLSSSEV